MQRGGPTVCGVFFLLILAGSVLYWAGSDIHCQLPEHKDPFFSCQSQPDVPGLVLKKKKKFKNYPSLALCFQLRSESCESQHTLTKVG